MKKLLLLLTLMVFLIPGCAGIQLKGDVKELLIEEIAWEAGYFTAKENPDIAHKLIDALPSALGATGTNFHNWIGYAVDELIGDPVLANRFKKLAELFEVDVAGIEDLAKRSERIGELMTEFSDGVAAGLQE